jgi:hypothetical protein
MAATGGSGSACTNLSTSPGYIPDIQRNVGYIEARVYASAYPVPMFPVSDDAVYNIRTVLGNEIRPP